MRVHFFAGVVWCGSLPSFPLLLQAEAEVAQSFVEKQLGITEKPAAAPAEPTAPAGPTEGEEAPKE